jgi:hypothetical protein
MACLPPVGWADVATEHDLHALEARLERRIHTEFAGVRAEMAEVRGELRTEMAEIRGDLRTEFQRGLRTTTIITVKR